MSGIAGYIHLEEGRIDSGILSAMGRSLTHRGPDDEGFAVIDSEEGRVLCLRGRDTLETLASRLPRLGPVGGPQGRIGLAHRGWALTPLSDKDHQPFVSSDGRFTLVIDGDLRNGEELRVQLRALGVLLRTNTDAELIAEAYRAWNTDCFTRLNGTWALALYDSASDSLLLSRDRIGEKPLFWARVGDVLYFGSEIKTLLAVPQICHQRAVDLQTAHHWLQFGVKDHDTQTFLTGIHSLAPGHVVLADREFPQRRRRYWRLPEKRLQEYEISVEEAATTIRELLEDAVSLRLDPGVSTGVDLGGDLSAAAILAFAARRSDNPVTAYAMNIADRGADHERHACQVAERLDTDGHIVQARSLSFWSMIGAFTRLMEEPYASPDLQAHQVIWTQMRARGTPVSLDALGAEPALAVHPHYFGFAQMSALAEGRLGQGVGNLLGATEFEKRHRAWATLARSALRGAVVGVGGSDPSAPRADPRLILPLKGKIEKLGQSPFRAWSLDLVLKQDLLATKLPQLVTNADRNAWGIPIIRRAPFLDRRVLDFCFQLPPGYLIREGWHQWILRKALETLLPDEVVWRRRRLRSPYRSHAHGRRFRPLIDVIIDQADNPLLDLADRTPVYRDWRVISFLLWYEWAINGNDRLFETLEARAAEIEGDADNPFPSFAPAYLAESMAARRAA